MMHETLSSRHLRSNTRQVLDYRHTSTGSRRKLSLPLNPVFLSRSDGGGGYFDNGRSEPIIAGFRRLVRIGATLV